jgi:hypothetical protein
VVHLGENLAFIRSEHYPLSGAIAHGLVIEQNAPGSELLFRRKPL